MKHLKNNYAPFALIIGLFLTASAQAATLTVDRTDDATITDCTAAANDCTLRGAITAANAGDTIVFSPLFNAAQSITLSDTGSALTINKNLTITGNGAGLTTVRRNSATTMPFCIFETGGGATVGISGLTVTGASVNSTNGGGILVDGSSVLTLTGVVVTANLGQSGGGIFINAGSTLNIFSSTVSNNNTFVAGGSIGGGILSSGTLNVNTSTFSGNQAGFGGGIYNSGGMVTVTNSTISGNSASQGGGGFANGAFNNGSISTLNNSTISNNSASNGGGIANYNSNTLTLNNTIIANSTSGGDCVTAGGTVNATYNLIEDGTTCVTGTNSNNLTGDPNLGALANNGGPTQTHALLAGSIAIDTGNSLLTTDQRGLTRPVNLATFPDAPGGNGSDIGAVELQIAPTAAGTTVGGRVTQANGSGIRNARVTMLDSMGDERFAVTDRQGFYQFENVPSGLVYVFSVAHLRYQFEQPTQVQFIGEEETGINFVGTSFTRFGDLWTVGNPSSKRQ